MATTRKKVINGSIAPRWPKGRVVKWLELGAIPALLGLYLPDWVGGYAHLATQQFTSGAGAAAGAGSALSVLSVPFPPVITYVGAVILLIACGQGIRGMGVNFKVLKVSGALAIAMAALSVLFHFLFLSIGSPLWLAMLTASIVLAFFFASGFFLATIAKVAEITTETRTKITQYVVLVSMVASLLVGLVAAGSALSTGGSGEWAWWLRLATILFGVTFVACRYGVYCYKTQRSIGAPFVMAPEEQLWI